MSTTLERLLPDRRRETNDFFAFWRPSSLVEKVKASGSLDYAASGQFGKVQPSDTVWIVSHRQGRLCLIGRIIVAQVVGFETAAALLGANNIWQAKWCVLPAPGMAMPALDIDIHDLAPTLRFVAAHGEGCIRFDERGMINGSYLQSVRRLTERSAILLNACIEEMLPVSAVQPISDDAETATPSGDP